MTKTLYQSWKILFQEKQKQTNSRTWSFLFYNTKPIMYPQTVWKSLCFPRKTMTCKIWVTTKVKIVPWAVIFSYMTYNYTMQYNVPWQIFLLCWLTQYNLMFHDKDYFMPLHCLHKLFYCKVLYFRWVKYSLFSNLELYLRVLNSLWNIYMYIKGNVRSICHI